MAIAKLILNSVTQMDVTGTTAVVSDVASGKKYIKADGTEGIGTASFGPAVTIEPLSVTANGTYSASSGYAFSPVTVDVPTGGGGDSVEEIIDRTISSIYATASVVGYGAFQSCLSLTTAIFPNATTISFGAFSGCSSLRSISFPNVSSIGQYAFYGAGIISPLFPNVTSIGSFAFQTCNSLVEITSTCFPKLSILPGTTFANNAALSFVEMPDLSAIYNNAFSACSSLARVSFQNVSFISATAFANCINLSNVYLPNLRVVSTNVFSGCSKLTEVSLPSVSIVSTSAFYRCTGLRSAYFNRLTSINSGGFNNCIVLSTLETPNLRIVGSSAFYSCSALSSVSMPNVVTMYQYAFAACTSINTAFFVLLSAIPNYAFSGCYNLLSLYLLSDSVMTLGTNALSNTPISNRTTSTDGVYGTIYVPSSLYNSYITATGWSVYSSRFASYTEPVTGPYVSMYSRSYFSSGTTGIWNAGWLRTPIVGSTYHISLNAEREYRSRSYSFDENIEWAGFPYTITPSIDGTPAGTETFNVTRSGVTHQISSNEEQQFFLTFSFEDV